MGFTWTAEAGVVDVVEVKTVVEVAVAALVRRCLGRASGSEREEERSGCERSGCGRSGWVV